MNSVFLSAALAAELRRVRDTKERPPADSDQWDAFVALVDAGLVLDHGLGDARITPAGRLALRRKPKSRRD